MDSHFDQERQSRRGDFIKLLCACVLASLGVAVLLCQSTASSQQADPRERKVDDKYSYKDCPIKIIGVETAKRKVVFGQAFSDDDDWMKGLKVRIENTSGKVVTHVGIEITFERPAYQADEPRAKWDLWYGVSPFYFKPREPIPPPLVRAIQPGEGESIALSDTDYDALKSFLKDVKFPSSIQTIHISVYTIGFADGTAWGGQLYRRDPSAPHGWRPANKPQGSTRNRAAFSYPFLLASYNQDTTSEWKMPAGRMRSGGPSLLKPPFPQGQCGSALIATSACPNQPSGCEYD